MLGREVDAREQGREGIDLFAAHDDRELVPVQHLRVERLGNGWVLAIVLRDDGHAAEHKHVKDAHAPAGARRAQAELAAQNLVVEPETTGWHRRREVGGVETKARGGPKLIKDAVAQPERVTA